MSKGNLLKTIDLPDFEEICGESKGEMLVNLYNHILDGKQVEVFDPRRVEMNKEDYLDYLARVQEQFPPVEETKIALMWMNQGPASSSKVEPGKIYLYEGYYQGLKTPVAST